MAVILYLTCFDYVQKVLVSIRLQLHTPCFGKTSIYSVGSHILLDSCLKLSITWWVEL